MKRIFTPIVGFVLLIALVFSDVYFFHIFSVKTVICTTQYGQCEQDDYQSLAQFLGKSLWLINVQEVVLSLANNPENKQVAVDRVFPNKLSVFILKRKGAAIVTERTDSLEGFVVSTDGYVLSFGKTSALPRIRYNGFRSLVMGEAIDEKLKNAVTVVHLIDKINSIEKAEVENDSLKARVAGGKIVYFPLDKDPRVLVGALQLILSRSKMNGIDPAFIDLRYKNPILR